MQSAMISIVLGAKSMQNSAANARFPISNDLHCFACQHAWKSFKNMQIRLFVDLFLSSEIWGIIFLLSKIWECNGNRRLACKNSDFSNPRKRQVDSYIEVSTARICCLVLKVWCAGRINDLSRFSVKHAISNDFHCFGSKKSANSLEIVYKLKTAENS